MVDHIKVIHDLNEIQEFINRLNSDDFIYTESNAWESRMGSFWGSWKPYLYMHRSTVLRFCNSEYLARGSIEFQNESVLGITLLLEKPDRRLNIISKDHSHYPKNTKMIWEDNNGK